MSRDVALRGSGSVELPAYGMADAEHRVEKEIAALWPGASVEVLEVSRRPGGGRIVEEFQVRYRVRGVAAAPDAPEPDAAAHALRVLRGRFSESRFSHIRLEPDRPAAT